MYRGLLLVGSALLPCMAAAQSTTTDGGQTTQRIDGYYEQRQPLQPSKTVVDPLQETPLEASATPARADGVRFPLHEVRFEPTSELLDAAALAEVRSRYVGRQVGMADLDALVEEINAAYQTKGITTAKALLRQQDLAGGTVVVTLMEGRLGKMQVTGEGEGKVPERFVLRRVHQQAGEIVQTDQLRDDLVYLNRTSDVQVRALLRPGEAAGQTDIMLMAQSPDRRTWGAFVDNSGVESTGRERFGVQGQFWGLAGVNDLLAGSVAYSRGGLEGRVSYSGIVNKRNGRVGVSVSRNQINIIDGAYRDLDITGESTNYGVDFTQPWIANQHWLLSSMASLSRSNSTSDIAGEQVSESNSTIVTVGLSTGYRNDGYDWSFYQGVSRIRADETLGKGRSFTTANGNTGWTQRIGATGFLYRAQLGWQFTSGDFLPSGNLFQVGGIGSVRGYVRGALSGVKGYYGSVELHRPYRQAHDMYVFFDHGEVRGDFPTSASMSSVGLGLNGQVFKRYSYSLDLGHPLDKVLKDQDSVRADFRISARW
ncbi:ShlB/FhaC/HecB family hemolysin secretion/activation protein [Stenotrophomonas sp.]|uniref:ShlB/FhaC/HecB family hemolysin secretion/activation protein n=1 Tax=Stenotrophomonas sp. TaxID=69392 RepID=UPI0028A87C94|nr:ShlB/FhaC/HecB family hemolysin secretion/activation protein [Stenotrophomonas sp.]